MTKLSLKRRVLSCARAFLMLIGAFFILNVFILSSFLETALAATLRSNEFTLESGVTPTPTPFQFKVELNLKDDQNNNTKPLRISLSSDMISFGLLSPTNPIKRKLTVSVDSGTSLGFTLFVSENHPLKDGEHEISDTTCDQGSCTEKIASEWINPFTFGLGFSSDDNLYRQFPDISKKESIIEIPQGTLFLKLNANQNQVLASKQYKNTITFLAIPKL